MKKRGAIALSLFLVILLSVSLVSANWFDDFFGGITGKVVEGSCTDTDGQNFENKGRVTVVNSAGETKYFNDGCRDTTHVYEWYCDGSTQALVKVGNGYPVCEFGCRDGKCLRGLYESSCNGNICILYVGGKDDGSAIAIVNNKKYEVQLISATDTSATIRVGEETKEISEGTSKQVGGLNVYVELADESTATNLMRAKIELSEVTEIPCTDSDGKDYYNKGYVIPTPGSEKMWDSCKKVTSPTCDSTGCGGLLVDDCIGEDCVIDEYICDPSSGGIGHSPYYCPNGCSNGACIGSGTIIINKCSDLSQEVKVRIMGIKDGLGDNAYYGDWMILKEGEKVRKTGYFVIGENNGYTMKVKRIYNDTTTPTNSEVEFEDISRGLKYDTIITSDGEGTVTIGGKSHTVNYHDTRAIADDEYVKIIWTPENEIDTFYCSVCRDKDCILYEGQPTTTTINNQIYDIELISLMDMDSTIKINGEIGEIPEMDSEEIGGLTVYVKYANEGLTIEEELSARINLSEIETTCTDTDGGIDYYEKGIIKLDGEYHNEDKCTSPYDGSLNEWYCEGDMPDIERYNCPKGCQDGACTGGICAVRYYCQVTPIICPASGIQIKRCEDIECGTPSYEEEIICNPGECAGCELDERCIPYGFRTRVQLYYGNQGDYTLYCNIDGRLREQQADWTACQNHYECESNFCSGGECTGINAMLQETGRFKAVFIQALCTILHPINEDNRNECIGNLLS